MQVWTPFAQPRDDGEFDVHLNPGKTSGSPFALIYLSEDTLTALAMETPGDCDRLSRAAAAAKALLLGETSEDAPEPEPSTDPEPNPALQCAAPHQSGAVCDRTRGHAGSHIEHSIDGITRRYWPRHDGGIELAAEDAR